MPDPLKKPSPGDPFRPSAAQTAAFIDAAQYVRDLKRRGGAGSPTEITRQTGIVQVMNASGEDLNQFGVLGIDDAIITPDENEESFRSGVALKGVTPTEDHAGKFLILLQPLSAGPDDNPLNGEIGRAFIMGAFPAKLNVTTEGDEFADVDPGDNTQLITAGAGAARILWKQSGTGEGKLGYVMVGGAGESLPIFQYPGMVWICIANNQNAGAYPFAVQTL